MKPYLFERKVSDLLRRKHSARSVHWDKQHEDKELDRPIFKSVHWWLLRVTLAVGRCSMSKPWEFQLTQSFYSDFFTI